MKIAIIGTAPASRSVAPFADTSWTVWACSPGNMGQLPRVDMWWEVHSIIDMTAPENRAWSINYFNWLKAQTFPVMMQERNDWVPQAQIFPLEAMVAKWGENWWTSSVAYMMAQAIELMTQSAGPHEIGIFGIDMAATEEHYSAQRSGCHRWIERAKEAGIVVTIPHESCLGEPAPMYGYNEATPFGRKMASRFHEVSTQRAQIDANITRMLSERAFFDGALEDIKYIMRTWTKGKNAAEVLDLAPIKVVELPAPIATTFQEAQAPAAITIPTTIPSASDFGPLIMSSTARPDDEKRIAKNALARDRRAARKQNGAGTHV